MLTIITHQQRRAGSQPRDNTDERRNVIRRRGGTQLSVSLPTSFLFWVFFLVEEQIRKGRVWVSSKSVFVSFTFRIVFVVMSRVCARRVLLNLLLTLFYLGFVRFSLLDNYSNDDDNNYINGNK